MRLNRIIFLLILSVLCACTKPDDVITPPPPDPKTAIDPEPNNNDDPQKPEDPGTPTDPTDPESGYIIVGYATYWDSTMPDPKYLTHINYAFAHIKSDFETLDIKTPSRLQKIANLKKTNPGLKVLLSVGGWGAGNFSEMAADATHRQNFCNNCLSAVKKYDLDGIDIDWEYPTSSSAGISSSTNDTKNFNLLMEDLRKTLGDEKLVTMASSASAKYVDFKTAIKYMDFVNIMTYDMGKPPYHNAGLYKSSKTKRSCDESVGLHYKAGVPYNKIVLGIPFYGHGNGKEFSTDCVDYNEIKFTGFEKRWDDQAKVPYLTNSSGEMVLSYDDPASVGLKADYVKEHGLLGAMYWNIEADDSKWSLSKAIAEKLLPESEPSSPADEDAFLATNEYVEKYLEEVTYTDTDYTTTKILGYPGGGPGTADVPPTYTITWDASSTTASQKLKVWEGSWSREYTIQAGTGKQDITNLVPGVTYEYMVTSSDGSVIGSGSFKTRGMLHQVFFQPNIRNGRDLGGWKGRGGKTVAYRKIYRGGRLDGKYGSSTGRKEMLAEGIRAEIDLREAEDVPKESPLGKDIAFFAPGFDKGYNAMVRDNQPKVKETFMFLVQCLREDKPVYFHCAAGRDRTGTLAILVLGALGVSESDMAKDYELTYFSPDDWSMSTDDNGKRVYEHTRNNYSYPSVRNTIFKETSSGTYQERIEKYLIKIGVPQKDIDDLRTIMLK